MVYRQYHTISVTGASASKVRRRGEHAGGRGNATAAAVHKQLSALLAERGAGAKTWCHRRTKRCLQNSVLDGLSLSTMRLN